MNTLTQLVPDLYEALDIVSREQVGFLPSITLDASLERAAVGQAIRIPIAPAATSAPIVPGQLPPDTGDQAIDNVPFMITDAEAVPLRITGEEIRGLSHGVGYSNIRVDQMAQAMRTLINKMELSCATTAYKRASRAYGTSGTTPFAGGGSPKMDDIVWARKMLIDNGCPDSDLRCVLDTMAGSYMRLIPNLTKVNEAGEQSFLRQGILNSLFGIDFRESAQVVLHTKGTANGSYDTNNVAGYAIGDRNIAVDTGTGTLVAGDVVTFTGDTNQYVVETALTGGVVALARPGLRQTLADGVDLTLTNAYRANMVFHRSAIIGAIRAPALPAEGDSAIDRMLITDPRTGITFEVSIYAEYRRVHYEIAIAWGFQNIKPEHTVILKG